MTPIRDERPAAGETLARKLLLFLLVLSAPLGSPGAAAQDIPFNLTGESHEQFASLAPVSFVTRTGTQLALDGQPYRFTGVNIYNANNTAGCWYVLGSGFGLDDSLMSIGHGAKVIRAWFFQSLATANGQRDWSSFDHTLGVAAARGVKVIATLGNQWVHCDGPDGGAGVFKDEAWYTGGYAATVLGGSTVPYLDWVAEVVTRYKDDPTILAWQLMNEAEVKPSESAQTCSTNAARILKSFATDVSGLIKGIDQNHLVSLGTIGGGQCGAQSDEYQDVHDVATIDLCEFHDYGSPAVPMPGDQFNGLQRRIDQCNALDKPLFVGETGIVPLDVPNNVQPRFPLLDRANAFEQKFRAQFTAGVVGELVWAWSLQGSTEDTFDIGPGDPVLRVLRVWNTPSPGSIARVSVPATSVDSTTTSSTTTSSIPPSTSSIPPAGSTTTTTLPAVGGTEANDRSLAPFVSADGRYVLFSSEATNLTPADTHSSPGCGALDVFLKDRETGAVELVSVDSDERQLGGFCGNFAGGMSADARYIAFSSDAYRSTPTAFVASDVLVRDRVGGTTENLTAAANGLSGNPTISADGRYVLFATLATNLSPGADCCGDSFYKLYVHDRVTGTLELVSVDSDENLVWGNANGANLGALSADGRFVAFMTDQDLVPEDVSQFRELDIYLRDRQAGTTTLVSKDGSGAAVGGDFPAITPDGRFIAYDSLASTIVPGDTNAAVGFGGTDVFVYDRLADTTERVSVDGDGGELEAAFRPSLSAGGRFVVFTAGHPRVTSVDEGGYFDVYIHDRETGSTERVVNGAGNPGGGFSDLPVSSWDGRFIVFSSTGASWVTGDSNGVEDVFLHERTGPVDLVPPPVPPDADGDGVADSVDSGGAPGEFADTSLVPPTTGSIVSEPAGLSVSVEDAAAPEDGVRIIVDGPPTLRATLSVCAVTLQVAGGSDLTVTCGSITVEVVVGLAEIVLSADTLVTVPAGVSATLETSADGSFVVRDVIGGTVTVSVEGVETVVEEGESGSFAAWEFFGFFPPVDNPDVLNLVKAGKSVPLKWRLTTAGGDPVTTLASVHISVVGLPCGSAGGADPLEEVAAAGASGLQNLGNGFYQFNWKTPKAYVGMCKTLHLDLGEGITRDAFFKLTK